MGWVSYFAAVLALLNTGWNIWRWRADRTYIAFAVRVTDGGNQLEFSNGGTAIAYNVQLAVLTANLRSVGDELAMPGPSIAVMRPDDDPVRYDWSGDHPVIAGWRIRHQRRPGEKVRAEDWDFGLRERRNRPTLRQRAGRALAGDR